MEYWDLYDENRNKLNKTIKRGEKLNDNEYHIVVEAWIKNDEGNYLISQRASSKHFAYKWEPTGGSILLGETSYDGALREVKEELGIDLSINEYELLDTINIKHNGENVIIDSYLFYNNTKIEDIIIQKEEVMDAKWVTVDELIKINNNKDLACRIPLNEILKKHNF